MKPVFKSLLAATALAASLFAANAQDTSIIVVSHGQASDPFWSVVKNGVAQAATDMGVNVDYRAPETFDMVAMAQLIDAAVNQNPAGLIVSIPDADALGPSIKKAVAAGIPVISMNSGSDVSKELGGKKAICINQEVGNVALDLRCKGFAEGFGDSTVVPASMDPAEVTAKVKAALSSDAAIDTIMSLGASTAGEPALVAIAESGKEGKVQIGTFDMSAGFLQAIVDGRATFAIDQQQYLQGYLPVVFLALNAKYGLMPGGNVPSGPNLITKEKAAQVIDLSTKGIR